DLTFQVDRLRLVLLNILHDLVGRRDRVNGTASNGARRAANCSAHRAADDRAGDCAGCRASQGASVTTGACRRLIGNRWNRFSGALCQDDVRLVIDGCDKIVRVGPAIHATCRDLAPLAALNTTTYACFTIRRNDANYGVLRSWSRAYVQVRDRLC